MERKRGKRSEKRGGGGMGRRNRGEERGHRNIDVEEERAGMEARR